MRTCDSCNKEIGVKDPVILHEERHDNKGVVTASFHEDCAPIEDRELLDAVLV